MLTFVFVYILNAGKFKIKTKNECDKAIIYLFVKTNFQVKNPPGKKVYMYLKTM